MRGIHNQSFRILTGIKCFPLRQRIRHVCFFYEAGNEILGRQLLSLEDRDMRFEVSIFNDFERERRPEPDKSQVSKTRPRRIGYTVRYENKALTKCYWLVTANLEDVRIPKYYDTGA